MRFATLILASALAASATGCTYSMNEYHAAGYAPVTRVDPDAPPPKPEVVIADAEQDVVLGITDNTDYVDEAYGKLLAQCGGDIVGVNTRYSTKLSFLSYTNRVHIQATCLRR
jgi:hypothetical protein